MAKVRVVYRCTECGTPTPKWAGRCAGCEAWNSLVEDVDLPELALGHNLGPSAPATPIGAVDATFARPQSTGIPELDRVLGGGLDMGAASCRQEEGGCARSVRLARAPRAPAGRRHSLS